MGLFADPMHLRQTTEPRRYIWPATGLDHFDIFRSGTISRSWLRCLFSCRSPRMSGHSCYSGWSATCWPWPLVRVRCAGGTPDKEEDHEGGKYDVVCGWRMSRLFGDLAQWIVEA